MPLNCTNVSDALAASAALKPLDVRRSNFRAPGGSTLTIELMEDPLQFGPKSSSKLGGTARRKSKEELTTETTQGEQITAADVLGDDVSYSISFVRLDSGQ